MLHCQPLVLGGSIQMGHFPLRSEGVYHSCSIYDPTGTELTDPSHRCLPLLNPSLLILPASPPRREYHPDLSPGRSDVKRWLSSI